MSGRGTGPHSGRRGKLIDVTSGLAALGSGPTRLDVSGFMPLVVEHVGAGPRVGELVSVAHYGEMNGDLMRDPEIVFEVVAGGWHPVSVQMDYTGSYREAVFVGNDGQAYVRPAEVRDIAAFARVWDRNVKHQGFVDAAEAD
jgi:hypothetical protein